MKTDLMKDLNESIEQSIKTLDLIGKLETLQQENEDLRNRSMRSILIFRGLPESEKKKMILGRRYLRIWLVCWQPK